ncbi:esterase/lipase family protein [Nocardia sp. KC 131]|uniref:esterase/lipase family protein n=1 Tax=Nocardia arseniciresistens TaxID=3392119 RepID=UPI00398E8295
MRAAMVGVAVVGVLGMTAAPGGAAPSDSAAPSVPAGTVIEPAIDCHPSDVRPNPVIVLPGADGGTADTAAQWDPMVSALRGQGACTLLFQGGIVDGKRWAGDMSSAARQLAQFVAKVKAVTGAAKVDIVAHSAGTFVANYFVKVLGGAADVPNMVLLTPEARGCDGAGFLAQYGLKNLPITPVQLITALPFLVPVLSTLMPSMANALQLTPASDVYKAVMNGPLTQPGVRYSVMATKNDAIATPPGVCSFITEPGVTNVFYEDLFPGSPAVDHSTVRSSPDTTNWVIEQLYS